MTTITRDEATIKMETTNGRIFRVNFTKKNGEERQMVCRTGVRKYVTGEGLKFDPKSRGLLGVFDLQAHAYRFVSLNKVFGLKTGGQEYTVAE